MEQPPQTLGNISGDVRRIISNEVIKESRKYTPFTLVRSINKQFRDAADNIGNPSCYEVPLHSILNYINERRGKGNKPIIFVLYSKATVINERTQKVKEIETFVRITWTGNCFSIRSAVSLVGLSFFLNNFDLDFLKYQIENLILPSNHKITNIYYYAEPLVWYSLVYNKPGCNRQKLLNYIRDIVHSAKEKEDPKPRTGAVALVSNMFSQWILGKCTTVEPEYIIELLKFQEEIEKLVIALNQCTDNKFNVTKWRMKTITYPSNLNKDEIKKWLLANTKNIDEKQLKYYAHYYGKQQVEKDKKLLAENGIDIEKLIRTKTKRELVSFISEQPSLSSYIENYVVCKKNVYVRDKIRLENTLNKLLIITNPANDRREIITTIINMLYNDKINPTKQKVKFICTELNIKDDETLDTGIGACMMMWVPPNHETSEEKDIAWKQED